MLLIVSSLWTKDYAWQNEIKKYSTIFRLIKDYFPEKVETKEIVFSSIKGLLSYLDPHSYFLDPVSLRSMFEDQKGNYYGIGIRITKYEDRLTVVSPLKGTPAYRLGIMSGDVIAEIEGKDTKKMSLNQAVKILRGEKNTIVHIKIRRQGVKELLPFEIKRVEIPLNSVSYALVHPLNEKIGYISVRTFGSTTTEEIKKALDKMIKEHNIIGVILDLRGNPGGSLRAAIEISDLFLPKGKVIVSIKGRKLNQTAYSRYDNEYENLKLAVLINRGSASASEIVAAAIKDNNAGVVLGVRSWGKGLVETVYPLKLQSALALTTAKYYTPSGKCLQRDFSKLDDYYFFFNKNYNTDKTISGGVIPNYIVKSSTYKELSFKMLSKGLFFRFAKEIIDKKMFKITKNFKADKRVISEFKRFLKRIKFKFKEKQFVKEIKEIVYGIENEVLSLKYSIEEGVKVFLKDDPVSMKALKVLMNKE